MNTKPSEKTIGTRKRRILTLLILFVVFGFVMIANSSLAEAQSKFSNQYFYLKKQIFSFAFALFSFFLAGFFSPALIKKTAPLIYFFGLFLLILLFVPGLSQTTLGAKRWLDLGFFSFQPTEIVKLSVVTFFPLLLSSVNRFSLKNFFLYLFPLLFLIIIQPDMGSTSIICGAALSLLFLSTPKLGQISLIILAFLFLGSTLIFVSPYRLSRLKTMLEPERDPTRSSYHVNQITLGLGLGGLLGQGLGNSIQKQHLPQTTTDSILAVAAEEFGFVGMIVFVFLFSLLLTELFLLSELSPDFYSRLATLGYASLLAIQGLINLGSIAVLIPLTGVPFPFVSYGGTSLVILMFSLGLVFKLNHAA